MLVVAATEMELACVGPPGGVTALCSGIGPIEAAVSTAAAIVAERPAAVLNIGLAGRHGFTEPELVIGTRALYCDATSDIVPRMALPDPVMLAIARDVWPDALATPIGTSAHVGGSTDCEVEAMEGFGVLRACALAGLPALEIRVTSNEISEPDRGLWRFDEALALLRAELPALIEALDA